MYTKLIAIACMGIVATACKKPHGGADATQPTRAANAQVQVTPSAFVPQRVTGYVTHDEQMEQMKKLYQPGDDDNCFTSGKAENKNFCFEWGGSGETSVGGNWYVYAWINGSNHSGGRHTQGKVQLLKFTLAEDVENHTTLTKIEDSGVFRAGQGYGDAPDITLAQINDRGDLAWLVKSMHIIHDRPRHVVDIFVSQNRKIVNIGMIDIEREPTQDNDEPGPPTKLYFRRPAPDMEYYTIEARSADNKNHEFRYNTTTKQYDIPGEYTGTFLKNNNMQL